jgi:two-component system, OmpR family, response regulator MprA
MPESHPNRRLPHFGLRRRARDAAHAGSEPGGAPLVLLADDDRAVRAALGGLLREAGFRVRTARNGLELLALARKTTPDAILLDLAMPRLDGVEAARDLSRMPHLEHTRVIATTSSWLGDRLDLLGPEGFDGALRKPFAPARLLAALAGRGESAEVEALAS